MKSKNSKIAQDILPPGLTEETVRQISATKNEPQWLLDWRLRAFHHWQKMSEPKWAKLKLKPIDYQKISYQALPKNFNPFGKSINSVKIQRKMEQITKIQAELAQINDQLSKLDK